MSSSDTADDSVVQIADELWLEQEQASFIDPPLKVKPYYDEMVRKEDSDNNKVMVDFKKPSDMSKRVQSCCCKE